jgi:hypothetical protein
MRSTGRAKYFAAGLSLIVKVPLPGITHTRATDSLRPPVA